MSLSGNGRIFPSRAHEELEELLNEIYDVKREEEERTVHETRYYDESGREVNWSVWDPNTGVSQDDSYTERGFIFSIKKKKEPMEVFRERLSALDHPDERKKLAELQESVDAAEKEQKELVGKIVTDFINSENIELTDLLSILGKSDPEPQATTEGDQSL